MFPKSSRIGMDIGSNSIKMVEVQEVNKKNVLQTYGIARHNLQLEGYWDSGKLRQLGTIIEDMYGSGNFSAVKTIMSVQSKDVYVTTMDFELGWSKKQIQDEIDKQAPYFLPYPPDEMRMSWSVIKNDPRIQSYTGKQRVIINALPDFVVENSKNLLEHVNLDGAALENQTVSQIRATLTPDEGNTVLVDIGSHHTTFSIIVDGVLRSSSHVPFGSGKISEELSQALGITQGTAEMFKKDLNLVNLFTLPPQVEHNFSVLKSELQSFVTLNAQVGQKPDKIVVTGGGVSSPGFLPYFSQLSVPVYPALCTRNLEIPQLYTAYITPIVNQLSTAIGLAIRDDV